MLNTIRLLSIAICAIVLTVEAGDQAQLPKSTRPLIFLPGIFGSKLCKEGDSKQVLWGTVGAMASFPELRVREEGDLSGPHLEPCGEIDEFVIFGPLGQDIYKHFLTSLEYSGYVRDKTLFVFSYDWRLSNFDNAKKLEADIETYITKSRLPSDVQFDVIGHSMGGIIATIVANGDNKRIARLITVATPYKGSIK